MAIYLAAQDLATTLCFLLFQDMSDEPKSMQHPIVNLLEKGQDVQSKS